MQKQLLVTFDYELFLGNRSGHIHDCMIEPTNRLMAIMAKHKIRSVFFVDTTYLLRLKKQAENSTQCAADFKTVATQLTDLVKQGHFVYPHVHPHWLDAIYDEKTNQWQLNDTAKYRFHNISDSEKAMVFNGSVKILEEILHPSFPDYKVNAYRAGGWCIQPFSDFKPYFHQNKIEYEFSVLGGIYQFTDAQYFDFSNAPHKTIYKFNDDVCVPESDGPFTQYNISSIPLSNNKLMLNKLWLKLLYKIKGDHTFNKGEGQPSRILNGIKPVSDKGHDLSDTHWERISVELLTAVKMSAYKNFLDQNKYMHFISHPKMITNHNLVVFDNFLDWAFEKYSVSTDFHSMLPE
jgi:hypothetical protein